MDFRFLLSLNLPRNGVLIRTLNLGLLLTLQITYMSGTTKAPAEHQNVQRWAGGKAGGKAGRLTKPVSADSVGCLPNGRSSCQERLYSN